MNGGVAAFKSALFPNDSQRLNTHPSRQRKAQGGMPCEWEKAKRNLPNENGISAIPDLKTDWQCTFYCAIICIRI